MSVAFPMYSYAAGGHQKVAFTKGFLVKMLDEYAALTAEFEELKSGIDSCEPGGESSSSLGR